MDADDSAPSAEIYSYWFTSFLQANVAPTMTAPGSSTSKAKAAMIVASPPTLNFSASLTAYLDSRALRFPDTSDKRRSGATPTSLNSPPLTSTSTRRRNFLAANR